MPKNQPLPGRQQIRQLVDEVIRPNAERIDREGIFPRENLLALARAGWNGVLIPEELGGLGLTTMTFAIAAEEIGRACASTALVYVMHVGAAQTILLYGNDDQKERWLRPGARRRSSAPTRPARRPRADTGGSTSARPGATATTTSSAPRSRSPPARARPTTTWSRRARRGAKGPTDISFFIVDGKPPGHQGRRLGGARRARQPQRPDQLRQGPGPARDRLGAEGARARTSSITASRRCT